MQGPLQAIGDLPFIDYQDQLPLPSTAWFPEPLEVETRQCLCLHVTAALTGERSLASVREAAVALRQEMLQESVEAFAHLGDAPPHVSEAEAFVRHNAHDCFYPHHEKDYRALALFAPAYLRSTQLLVLRVSQAGRVEGDVVRGDGAATAFGCVVIHRGHMRLLDLTSKQYHILFEQLEQAGRLVREVEAQGWAPFLDRTDLLGKLLPSRPAPCACCHRPQMPCRAGLPHTEAPWDPPLSPVLPVGVFRGPPLSERAATGVRSPGRHRPPAQTKAPPRAAVPNLWQFGNPCTTFYDYQRLNGGTRTVTRPEGTVPVLTRFKVTSLQSSRLRPTWWLVSAELFPWVHLFVSRHCPGVGTNHQHAKLGGPSEFPPPGLRSSIRSLSVMFGGLLFGPLLSSGTGPAIWRASVPSRRCPSTSSGPARLLTSVTPAVSFPSLPCTRLR